MLNLLKKFSSKKDILKLINQFIKFGLVGAVNTILSYAITNIGFYVLGMHEQLSNLIAFVITVFISFLLNRKFVFNEQEANETSWIKQLIKVYASYSITGLFLTALLLYFEETILGVPHYIATLMNLIVTIPLNFILNKLWAFKN